jgi:hypothetical protein
MNLNPSIILAGQAPDIIGSASRGVALADQQRQLMQQNKLAAAYADHGAGAIQGNQNALAQIAGVDPQFANQITQQRQGQANTDRAFNRSVQVQDRQFANQERAFALQMQDRAAAMTAQQRAAEAEEIKRGVFAASAAQTPEQWDQTVTQFGQPDLVGRFAEKDMLLSQYMTAAQILEANKPESSSVPAAIQELDLRAKAAGLTEGTPEYQSFMLNGGADPATFRALDMQAQAAGLVEGTPEYQEFMATRGAGQAASAKTTATNIANVETGGEAARVKAAGTAQGKQDVVSGSELAEMQRNLPGLLAVTAQLEVLADKATYTKAGQLANEARKQLGLGTSEGAVARAEYIAMVDNQVLPLLRQTFGAAFTAKEGESLRATLGDPDKSPAEKKAVLNAFIEQKKRDLEARGGTVQQGPAVIDGYTIKEVTE